MKNSLVLDDNYLAALLHLLRKAKRSVDVLEYSFAVGSAAGKLDKAGSPFRIAQELISCRQRGVRVRLYIESQRETAARNAITIRLLKSEGIEIKKGQTHAKGFLVDGKQLLFGSTNLTNQSLHKNRETNILTTDKKAISQFERYYSSIWEGAGHGETKLAAPLYADGDFLPALMDLIDRAKRSLAFSIYFFDLRKVEQAFIRAHQRGVKIIGMMGRHQSFAFAYVRRTVATARRLSRAGLSDLWYGKPHSFTHSKYIIRDNEELFLGTGNWLEEDVLIHPQLYMSLRDKKLASSLVKHLKKQIREEGTPNTSEQNVRAAKA